MKKEVVDRLDIRDILDRHVKQNNGRFCRDNCICKQINSTFKSYKDLIGKKFVDERVGSETFEEVLKVNAQDRYGIYYSYDGRQWVVYWYEVCCLDFLDGIE